MTEPSWPAPGVDCVCINPEGWRDLRKGPFGIIMDFGPRPGPECMKQYKIASLGFFDDDDDGHRLKLRFSEFPDESHCACQFQPLQTIEDEVKETATAPVDDLVKT